MIKFFLESGVIVFVIIYYMDEVERCDIVVFMFNGILKEIDMFYNVKKKYMFDSIEDVFVKVFFE